MQYCSTRGTFYQMGFQHGQSYAPQIRAAFEVHCAALSADVRFPAIFEDIKQKMLRLLPQGVEELQGIADGCGMDFDEILMLNNWEDIFALLNRRVESQCTSICFKTGKDGIILGKTTDVEQFQVNDYFLHDMHPETGYTTLLLGKIGTLKCEAGINIHGLCVGSSSSVQASDKVGLLERMTVLKYLLINCKNVDEGIMYLRKFPFYRLGLNILLLDRSGKAVVAECGNTMMAVRETDTDYIYATNFFMQEDMKKDYDYSSWYYENACGRTTTLEEIFADEDPVRSIEGMKAIIRSHDHVQPLCNHMPDCESLYATIWVPEKLEVHACAGRPCETDYEVFALEV